MNSSTIIASAVGNVRSMRIDPARLRVHAALGVSFPVDGCIGCEAKIAEAGMTLGASNLIAAPILFYILLARWTGFGVLLNGFQASIVLLLGFLGALLVGCTCLAFMIGTVAWYTCL